MLEAVIAVALLIGVVVNTMAIVYFATALTRKHQALARAQAVLSDHIAIRFDEWGLTLGESDVALFALKGCDIAQIANLRGVAMGTIRAQLSQIYTKAGVTSQAMLVSLFIQDLLDPASTQI